MNVGDVLHWPDFRYKDGGAPTPKLMLIVGVDGHQDALLLKTTSRAASFRPDSDGCHPGEGVYRFRDNPAPFDMPTWVQFDDPYDFPIAHIRGKGIKVCFSLAPEQIRAVINCLRRSPDYARWMAGYGV